jgi:hypothetical protein
VWLVGSRLTPGRRAGVVAQVLLGCAATCSDLRLDLYVIDAGSDGDAVDEDSDYPAATRASSNSSAGMGVCSRHVMAMGRLPSCWT